MYYILTRKRLLLCIFIASVLILSSNVIICVSADSAETESVQVPIIMYHEIKTFKTGRDVITPEEFESDLKYIKENGYNTITMTQLIDYVYEDGTLPEKPIVLTFDDGYLNNYKYALPLLEKYDMVIVLSIIGKNSDDFTAIPDDNLDYSHVTWDQINEMADSGFVEVQNHTYNLHSLNKRIGCVQMRTESYDEYERILSEDLSKLQNLIYECTGVLPNTFTYPYGRYNDRSDEIVKKLGFKATLTCDYGINVIHRDPDELFGLKRIARAHGTTIKKLLADAQKTIE